MASLMPVAKQRYFDNNNRPLIGGRIHFFEVGTETPKDTWVDENKSILNENPVVLDARGEAFVFGEGVYRIRAYDSLGNLIWDKDKVSTYATSDAFLDPETGASLIGFIQSAEGSTGRTVLDKLREVVSPKDFGAKGDGATDDTSAINRAITYALSTNCELNWPRGTYRIEGNLGDFHKVVHRGSGIIKRESTTFYITPIGQQKNTLFVSLEGSETNDGLTPDLAKNSLTAIMNDLHTHEAALLNGIWGIKILAGTYSGMTYTASDARPWPVTLNPLRIEGEYTGTYPNITHQTIIQGGDGTSRTQTFLNVQQGDGRRAEIHGLHVKNMRSCTTWWGGGICATRYCKFEDCEFPVFHQGRINTDCRYNIFDNCAVCGYIQYSSLGSVYYNKVKDCRTGFIITRNSSAHVDFVDFDGVNIGIQADLNARISANSNTFKRTNIANSVQSGGIILDNDCDYGVYGTDTKQILSMLGTGVEVRTNGYTGTRYHIQDVWAALYSLPANNTSFLSDPASGASILRMARAGLFCMPIRTATIKIHGSLIGTGSIRVQINSTTFTSPFDTGQPAGVPFVFEFKLFSGSMGYVDAFGKITPATGVFTESILTMNGVQNRVDIGGMTGSGNLHTSNLNASIGIFDNSSPCIVRRVEWITS